MNTKNADELSFARRNYRPLLELGRGGMARVFLAESLASGIRKLVVLKILNRELASEPEIRAAFRREAELSAQMNHPNVVQVLEVVEHSGTPVIVMEYLDGIALSAVNAQTQQDMPLSLHLHIFTQVLAGLHHFHELTDFDGQPLNAVHRDVSPQNVMVLHDGPIKVLDFGIAKVHAADQHTRAGIVKGKLHYMPPEQLLGEATLDRRADLFAVGIMLWEAVAKRRLWSGFSENGVVRALARGEVPRIRDVVPDVAPEIEAVIERSMEFDVAKRYATAEEMQLALEQAIAKTGGFVQARDVSNFMQKHFGEKRQFRRRAIERSLRDPEATLSGVMECVTPRSIDAHSLHMAAASGRHPKSGVDSFPSGQLALDAASERSLAQAQSFAEHYSELPPEDVVEQASQPGSAESGRHLHTESRTALSSSPHGSSRAAPTRRSRAGVALIGAALVVAAGVSGWFVYAPKAPLGSGPAVVASTVQLQIAVTPSNAEVVLGGRTLGTGAYRGNHAVSSSPVLLEVRAPGYVTERRNVQLRESLSLEIVLTADPAPAQAAEEPAQAAPSATAAATAPARPRARVVRGPLRAPRAQAPATAATPPPASVKPAPNCNPPYRLTADGVQVFKPECL